MENKTAEEVNQVEQVTPAPAVEVAKTETPPPAEVKPTDSPVENKKKEAAAFIKMRMENRELKRQLASMANPAPVTPQAEVTPAPAPVVTPPTPAPVQTHTVNLDEEKKALEALAMDKDLANLPNGLLDVMEMVEADPRLSKLRDFDPTIAYREAKTAYLAKAGVTSAPPVPVAHTPAGGVSGGGNDLAALIAECEKAKPGTKEFNSLVKKINAEMAKMPRL